MQNNYKHPGLKFHQYLPEKKRSKKRFGAEAKTPDVTDTQVERFSVQGWECQ
jgi:hypothetical protein